MSTDQQSQSCHRSASCCCVPSTLYRCLLLSFARAGPPTDPKQRPFMWFKRQILVTYLNGSATNALIDKLSDWDHTLHIRGVEGTSSEISLHHQILRKLVRDKRAWAFVILIQHGSLIPEPTSNTRWNFQLTALILTQKKMAKDPFTLLFNQDPRPQPGLTILKNVGPYEYEFFFHSNVSLKARSIGPHKNFLKDTPCYRLQRLPSEIPLYEIYEDLCKSATPFNNPQAVFCQPTSTGRDVLVTLTTAVPNNPPTFS